jgi:hypothetical protein
MLMHLGISYCDTADTAIYAGGARWPLYFVLIVIAALLFYMMISITRDQFIID